MGGIDPIVLPTTHYVFRTILGVRDKLKNRDLVRYCVKQRRHMFLRSELTLLYVAEYTAFDAIVSICPQRGRKEIRYDNETLW